MNISKSIVEKVIKSSSMIEALYIFLNNRDELKRYKFIFSKDEGSNLPESIRQRQFKNGAGVFNIFLSNKIIILDNKAVNEMLKFGKTNYTIDCSLSLDTMIVSYLETYLEQREVPPDFKEIFKFISQENINVDPMPYIIENIQNLSLDSNKKKIYIKLKAYEILRTIDIKELEEHNKVSSLLSDVQLDNNVKENIAIMERISKDKESLNYIESNYNLRYCLLLKMIVIQLKNRNSSIEEKLNLFFEFCNVKLGIISTREVIIAYEYFKKDTRLKFFGKVHKGKSDLIKVVRNMAWDLYHISEMERKFTNLANEECDYFIPAFLTYDKRLIEIIKLYKLNAIAVSKDGKEIYPSYDFSEFMDYIHSSNKIVKYFSNEYSNIREKNRCKNIEEAIECLEKELREM